MVLAVLGIVISFSSCQKDDSNNYPEEGAAVTFTNASPTANSIDLYIGGQKINSTDFLYGQKIGYITTRPGSYNATVTASGNSKTLYAGNFTLINQAFHSLYIVSKGDSISYLNVKDEFTTPPTGKAMVRFINLASDAPSYNLEITADTAAFTNKTYKTYTAFKAITPQPSITINLRDKASNAVVATLANVEFRDQKYYTVWAKGLVNTSVDAQKISLQVSQHFQ